jgi:hypothetical protein
MDDFALIEETLCRRQWLGEWPEMQALFHKLVAARPRHWRLPSLACQAAGGAPAQAVPVMAAHACFHISIILVDDMLDDDLRGEYNRIGAPATANLAVAFAATGARLIAASDLEPAAKSVALAEVAQMLYTTALGQNLDLQNPSTEDDYWRLVRKAAPSLALRYTSVGSSEALVADCAAASAWAGCMARSSRYGDLGVPGCAGQPRLAVGASCDLVCPEHAHP